MNTFYHGDCLFVMNHDIKPESVDLIYLDPPFFTGKIQKGTMKWQPAAMEISFEDRKAYWAAHLDKMRQKAPLWLSDVGDKHPEFAAYLYYMMERLWACSRVLQKEGSIYLHCDYRASHYLKHVLDDVFGYDNFRNEIAWVYTRPGTKFQKQFPRTHDTILWYSKGNKWTFNVDGIRIPYSERTIERGKYSIATSKVTPGIEKRVLPKKGKCPESWWAIPMLQGNERERLGYPTQKPERLLNRIILASSNENDVVLDPFCGCGTAIISAHKHNRQWIGIDINKEAWRVILEKANKPSFEYWLNSFKQASYVSRDLDEVKAMNPIEFEVWVNQYYGADKPYPDKYVDGITKERIPIQTRATSGGVDFDEVHAFRSAMQYHPKLSSDIKQGIFVSMNGFSDRARQAVTMIEAKEGIIIRLVTPEDMLRLQ
jgi:site-specific DNA-methyltransferase (adenine-specific)